MKIYAMTLSLDLETNLNQSVMLHLCNSYLTLLFYYKHALHIYIRFNNTDICNDVYIQDNERHAIFFKFLEGIVDRLNTLPQCPKKHSNIIKQTKIMKKNMLKNKARKKINTK